MKKIIKNSIISSIVLLTLMFLFSINQVKATTNEEEKIMCYDKATGKTTEVDMDAIEASLRTIYRSNSIPDYTEAYDPPELQSEEESISAYGEFQSVPVIIPKEDMTKTPYRKTCYIKYDGGSCSGFIANNNLILTAIHGVFNKDKTVKKNWTAYPGYYKGSSYKGLSTTMH